MLAYARADAVAARTSLSDIHTPASSSPAGTGSCKGLSPQVYPNFGASSLFVYHPNAVAQWRRHVISFALGSIIPEADRARFATLWDEIAGLQLGSTLTYLAPANAIGLFPVTVNTAPYWGK